MLAKKKLSLPDVCQCCLSASLDICSWERWAGGVGKGLLKREGGVGGGARLSREGGVGGRELGRDMLEVGGGESRVEKESGREGRASPGSSSG